MNKQKIHLLAQCIVNRTIGHDVKVYITMSNNSSVNWSADYYHDRNIPNSFEFGCFDEQRQFNETWHKIICKKYPVAKTFHPALFAMLHEVGHIKAPNHLTNWEKRNNCRTSEEYRELEDEAFADKWAADYISKNKVVVQLWDKQIREAL